MNDRQEIVPIAPASIELQGLSNDALKSRLREAVGLTETAIRNVASLWVEAVRRGMDLSDVKFSLAPLLPRVASGQLLPALVVSMAGQKRSLERIAELPVADQTRLAAGETVKIWRADTGSIVEKPLAGLSFPELSTVIRGGKILTPEQQRQAALNRPVRQPRKSRIIEFRVDAETYAMAAEAAAQSGDRMDVYLRRIILAALRPHD